MQAAADAAHAHRSAASRPCRRRPALPRRRVRLVRDRADAAPARRGALHSRPASAGPTSASRSARMAAGACRRTFSAVAAQAARFAIEHLLVAQLLVTTPGPGDRPHGPGLCRDRSRSKARSSSGLGGSRAPPPACRSASSPARSARTGRCSVKLAGGGDLFPRFDIDARLALEQRCRRHGAEPVAARPRCCSARRRRSRPRGLPIPIAVEAAFKTAGRRVELEPVRSRPGRAAPSLRLTGAGAVQLDEPRVALKLEGRRLDVDSFVLSRERPAPCGAPAGAWTVPASAVPIELDLSLNEHRLRPGGAHQLRRPRPPDGRRPRGSSASPSKDRARPRSPQPARSASTRPAAAAASPWRRRRPTASRAISSKLKVVELLPRRARRPALVEAADDRPRRCRSRRSATCVSRPARRRLPATCASRARTSARGTLEAQVAVQGLDLAQLPQVCQPLRGARRTSISASSSTPGTCAPGERGGAGRIAARILSDAPGARGREPRHRRSRRRQRAGPRPHRSRTGRAASQGKVTAPRAAPLVDLLGTRLDRRRLEAGAGLSARGRPRSRRRHRARGARAGLDRAAPEDHRARHRRRRRVRGRGPDRRRLDREPRRHAGDRQYRALGRRADRARPAPAVAR